MPEQQPQLILAGSQHDRLSGSSQEPNTFDCEV
jgi:hypothetical protein